jgi:hypothetical protein
MRLSLVILLLAACGARQPSGSAKFDDNAPYRVSAENEHKLSPYVVRQWRDLGLPRGDYTPIIVTIAGDGAAATEALTSFGAAFVRPVVTSPGAAGTLHARATESSDQLLAMLPNDALRFVVAQPWVVRLDGANSWPSGPELPADVERRLDPELRSALRALGRERPYAVGGIAETRGCLDDAQREKLVELGAIVGSEIAHPSCTHTILTFEIPLSRLVALASLPWIVQLEGSRPMSPEDIGEPDDE